MRHKKIFILSLSLVAGFFVGGFLFLPRSDQELGFRHQTLFQRKPSSKIEFLKQVRSSEKNNQSFFSDQGFDDLENMLKTYLPNVVWETVKVRISDWGPAYVRLSLENEGIPIEYSDFHFEKDTENQWILKNGEWLYGAVHFPEVREALSESRVEALVIQELSRNIEIVGIKKLSEFWQIRNHEAQQLELWRVEYRSKEEGLRKENFLIEVSTQSLLRRTSGLRH